MLINLIKDKQVLKNCPHIYELTKKFEYQRILDFIYFYNSNPLDHWWPKNSKDPYFSFYKSMGDQIFGENTQQQNPQDFMKMRNINDHTQKSCLN